MLNRVPKKYRDRYKYTPTADYEMKFAVKVVGLLFLFLLAAAGMDVYSFLS